MYRNPGSRTGIMRHTTPAPIGLVTLLITSAATLAAPPVQATERVLTPREPSRRVWHQLQELSQAEKANARIQLEIAAGTEPLVCPDTADIEQAWNRGEHDRAIDQLRRLEEAGFEAAVAVDWIAPESVAEADWGPDARIGTRIDLSSLEFDFHEETGRLFVVTEYATCDSEQTSWAVWMSTDGGRNWARTFTCYADLCTRGVAAAVAGDYLYVAYLWVLCELEVRRFFAATGSADHGYGVKVAFARGCDREPTSWAMTSNADSYDTNVYLVAAACDGSLRYAYARTPGSMERAIHRSPGSPLRPGRLLLLRGRLLPVRVVRRGKPVRSAEQSLAGGEIRRLRLGRRGRREQPAPRLGDTHRRLSELGDDRL